ncbi:MAG: hypothetical protein R3C03_01460 [Pirellulaceae bacterium]
MKTKTKSRKSKAKSKSPKADELKPSVVPLNSTLIESVSTNVLGETFSAQEIRDAFLDFARHKSLSKCFDNAADAVSIALADRDGVEQFCATFSNEGESARENQIEVGEANWDKLFAVMSTLIVTYDLQRFLNKQDGEQIATLFKDIETWTTIKSDLLNSDPVVFILAAVELPFVIAAGLPSIPRTKRVVKNALTNLELAVEQLFDESGWLHCDWRSDLGVIIASMTRVRILANEASAKLSQVLKNRLEWIGLQYARMLDSELQPMLGASWISEPRKILKGLRKVTEDESEKRLFKHIKRPSKKPPGEKDLPASADFGEEAMLGSLRCNWSANSPRIGIAADKSSGIQVEIGAHAPLISGLLQPTLEIDNAETDLFNGEFELNCWHSDKDIHYVELERKIPSGHWQRQFALCRPDNLLLVADAFLFDEEHDSVHYELGLPLASDVETLQETETRETYLKTGNQFIGLVLPLSLGEWKSDRTKHELMVQADSATFAMTRRGRTLYNLFAIDLDMHRCTSPRTWRKLNVAERLENVGDDVAVAYRFQIGKQQWVVYRNLTAVGNRTFMGKNVHCDFYVGRINSEHLIEQIIEIE